MEFTHILFWLAVISISYTFALGQRRARRKKEAEKYNRPRADIKPYTPPAPKPKKPNMPPPIKATKPGPNPETIKAMQIQADAERVIAEALQRKITEVEDPIKRARIQKQIALSWVRFNKILDQVDKLTA